MTELGDNRSEHTSRAYLKEIRRFLVWLDHAKILSLAAVKREDVLDYRAFARAPAPEDKWIGPAKPYTLPDGQRNPEWRPFEKALTEGGLQRSDTLLSRFFQYLVAVGYLPANPFSISPFRKRLPKQFVSHTRRQRFFDSPTWSLLWQTLEELPQCTEWQIRRYERLRWLLQLLYLPALRVHEACGHAMQDFRLHPDGWALHFTGKGGRAAILAVPTSLVTAMARYRGSLGLPPLPPDEPRTPLILDLHGSRGVTTRQVNRMLQYLFRRAAQRIGEDDPTGAEWISAATSRWLRRTRASHMLHAGVPRATVLIFMRHLNDKTLDVYTHVLGPQIREALALTASPFP